MEKNLKKKAFSSIKWNSFASILVSIAQFVGTIVIARILSPYEFGLFGLAVIVISFARLFSDFGFFEAILHEEDLNNEKTMTFFWMSLSIGFILMFICALLSPLFALFFEEDSMKRVVQMLSLVFLFTPSGIFIALLRRDLLFKKAAIVEIIAVFGEKGSTIIFAYKGWGVYSIVYGTILGAFLRLLVAVVFSRKLFVLKAVFDTDTVRKYLSFGMYRFGSKTMHYLSTNIEKILIGRLLGVEALGYYNITYSLVIKPVGQLHPMIHKVTIPLLCKCRETIDQLKNTFYKVNRHYFFLVFPILFGISSVADPFAKVIYGEKWLAIIPLIQILAISEVFKSVWYSTTILQVPTGMMSVGFKWSVIQLIVKTTFVSIAAYFGLIPLAWSVFTAQLIFMFLSYNFMIKKMIGPNLKEYAKTILKPLLLSLMMYITVVSVINVSLITGAYINLIAGVSAGVVSYMVVLLIFEKGFYRNVFDLIKSN